MVINIFGASGFFKQESSLQYKLSVCRETGTELHNSWDKKNRKVRIVSVENLVGLIELIILFKHWVCNEYKQNSDRNKGLNWVWSHIMLLSLYPYFLMIICVSSLSANFLEMSE